MAENDDFYGQGWAFPPRFDVLSRQTVMTADEASIHTSLHILMRTSMGERLMQPLYGADLWPLVFQPNDQRTATLIQNVLQTAIVQWEPRIVLNGVSVDQSRWVDGILTVTVDYTTRTSNTRNNIVFPFYLEEGNLVPANLT
jgi:uncharacterized protein